jgi:hypothetical protein
MSEELFRDFWWLIFPVFGMVMAVLGCRNDARREERVLREARANLERAQ